MRRSIFVCTALAVLIGVSGCAGPHGRMKGGCGKLAAAGRGFPARGTVQTGPEMPGPTTGTVAYPYYTTRGPRDFLAADPPSIGP